MQFSLFRQIFEAYLLRGSKNGGSVEYHTWEKTVKVCIYITGLLLVYDAVKSGRYIPNFEKNQLSPHSGLL
jgi:hypothetical protein